MSKFADTPAFHNLGRTMRYGELERLSRHFAAFLQGLPALVKELGRWKWSIMTGVNTLFNGLLNNPGFDRLDFSSLKAVIGGGAAAQEPVAERWRQATGRYITEGYGLTEASPVACANPIGTPWNGTIGIPYP